MEWRTGRRRRRGLLPVCSASSVSVVSECVQVAPGVAMAKPGAAEAYVPAHSAAPALSRFSEA
jgi:hypothetical protein